MDRFTPPDRTPVNLYHDRPDMPFETSEDIVYRNGITRVYIPAGFRLDFASVPRFFWWLFPRVGRYCRAALVHDALYRDGLSGRAQADALFLDIMTEDGVDPATRKAMYYAVRVFGRRPWKKLRTTDEPGYKCLVQRIEPTEVIA